MSFGLKEQFTQFGFKRKDSFCFGVLSVKMKILQSFEESFPQAFSMKLKGNEDILAMIPISPSKDVRKDNPESQA